MIRRLRKGAQVEEVYLAPFRGKDYRHKTVCHTGEDGVLRFRLQSLGDAGKEAIQIKDRCGFLTRGYPLKLVDIVGCFSLLELDLH